jgi:predicted kinase
MLYIFGGLPGTGKTTISQHLARELQAVYLRIDVIEHALRQAGVTVNGPQGYMVAYSLAEHNLRLGMHVVADSVNPIEITRSAWRGVAERVGVPYIEIELICSDAVEHKRRVETRSADIAGFSLPTWEAVEQRQYEPWITDHIVVDTAGKSEEQIKAELQHLLGEEKLAGGNMTTVSRIGNTVRRGSGPWTQQVHQLLAHLRAKGIQEVPAPLGFDQNGREVLSYIPGLVGHYPLPAVLRSDEVLVSAARLLRRIHDATEDVAQRWQAGVWQAPVRTPVEVICHGDFAPYNCVFDGERLVGVIDFDHAHPGNREWDIAYAIYRFAPITAESNPESFGTIHDQCRRVRLFCDEYGLNDRTHILHSVKARITYMAEFLRVGAANGDQRLQSNIDAGHLEIYTTDYAYLSDHFEQFLLGLD